MTTMGENYKTVIKWFLNYKTPNVWIHEKVIHCQMLKAPTLCDKEVIDEINKSFGRVKNDLLAMSTIYNKYSKEWEKRIQQSTYGLREKNSSVCSLKIEEITIKRYPLWFFFGQGTPIMQAKDQIALIRKVQSFINTKRDDAQRVLDRWVKNENNIPCCFEKQIQDLFKLKKIDEDTLCRVLFYSNCINSPLMRLATILLSTNMDMMTANDRIQTNHGEDEQNDNNDDNIDC